MNSLKPEIINLYKDRENHQAWLLANGMRQEDIQEIFIKFSQDQVQFLVIVQFLDIEAKLL